MKQQLQTAKDRAKSAAPAVSTPADAGAARGAAPGGLGGLDFASMMNNPAIAQMAQQMMQNPEMLSSLMNNPMLQKWVPRRQGMFTMLILSFQSHGFDG